MRRAVIAEVAVVGRGMSRALKDLKRQLDEAGALLEIRRRRLFPASGARRREKAKLAASRRRKKPGGNRLRTGRRGWR